jgi:hypothetical protein
MLLVGEVAERVSYLQSLWRFNESTACSYMEHALSTVPTRSVINSDENVLIHCSKRDKNLQTNEKDSATGAIVDTKNMKNMQKTYDKRGKVDETGAT